MALVESESVGSRSRASSVNIARKTSWGSPIVPSSEQYASEGDFEKRFDNAALSSDSDCLTAEGVEAWNTLDSIAALGLTLTNEDEPQGPSLPCPRFSLDDTSPTTDGMDVAAHVKQKVPFHHWIKTLHRRGVHRSLVADGNMPRRLLDYSDRNTIFRAVGHRKSSSGSSFGFVAAVKSVSISLASVSTVTRSRRNTGRSRAYSKTERSSRASISGARMSEDSFFGEAPLTVDLAAAERSLQRRRILEELITTEEGYIGDIRFLMNVYVTILASLPTLPMGLRSSINRNLTEIVRLHEEILGQLHRAVPHSEYTQLDDAMPLSRSVNNGHRRWHSLDAVPEDHDAVAWLQKVPGLTADPQVAAEVAKIFRKKMNRFFIYEEYGAKYEMMIKDVASAHRTMPQWDTYQKGLETLASSFGSANSNMDQSRRSLTIGDLLVKPIQRICKYPLLFAELLKYTPIEDCPNSHMEVESALLRLREATAEINRATNDARMKSTLEKTWVLQDRLVFPNQRLDAASKNRIRSFGHVELCGALHVCWQTKEAVNGQYMVCLLYHEVLCLASAGRTDQIYAIQACINLNSIKVEEVDNGRGLQCHTAPFSWKLVFECDFQLFEIIMTACTPREQEEWRSRLSQTPKEGQEQIDPNLYSSLSLNIKSLGTVFGKPGTIARRISIHRATTVGPKSPLCQVILKNTSVMRDSSHTSSGPPINRSQSLLTTNTRIPVLAPHRGERARLEALLSDIWSRESLPFPSMTGRARSERLVRNSATSMIRKLSVASIASSFTKRSASVASMSKLVADDEEADGNQDRKLSPKQTKQAEPGVEQDSRGHQPNQLGQLKLQVRKGEMKKTSESILLMPTFEPTDLMETVERLDANTSVATDVAVEDGCITTFGTPALRTTSANSIRLSRHTSISSKKSPCPSENEKVFQPVKAATRASGRWGRGGGVLNRDTMVQGIRSFFR